jgi:hypothetical protein
MAFIPPLELKTWFVNVLAGDASYFAPIAIFAIISLAGYFRMTGLTLGFMLFVFLLMFSGYIPASLLVFISLIGGLLVGYVVSRIVK